MVFIYLLKLDAVKAVVNHDTVDRTHYAKPFTLKFGLAFSKVDW
jgi:hypothetical protein